VWIEAVSASESCQGKREPEHGIFTQRTEIQAFRRLPSAHSTAARPAWYCTWCDARLTSSETRSPVAYRTRAWFGSRLTSGRLRWAAIKERLNFGTVSDWAASGRSDGRRSVLCWSDLRARRHRASGTGNAATNDDHCRAVERWERTHGGAAAMKAKQVRAAVARRVIISQREPKRGERNESAR